ncbi:MAG: heme-binding domain-containing protein [Weeksellaceae bacterium]|nr:heme-binding domain-containing protein [Weeksellaceae bacterium]
MKKILVVLLVAFILIQFFRIDRTNPPVNQGMDFLTIKNTPQNTANLIRNGCYDCHSNETKYPWYTNIQPIAWFLKSHIDEGRKKLNFSTFATYEPKRQAHKLYEAVEMVETGEMPLESYILGHPEAKFTTAQRDEIVRYFKSVESDIRTEYDLPPEEAKK